MDRYTAAMDTHGLVLRDRAIETLGEDRFEHEVETGRLRRERPRVYAVEGAPATARRELLAACWTAGGWGSHKSGLWLYGLRHVPARHELTVPRGTHARVPGVRVHESTYLPPHHLTVVDGIPVTTPARTAVDASAVMGDDRLGPLLDLGERLRVWTYHEVYACFEELQARGRRRFAHLRPYLEMRLDGYEPGDSDLEPLVKGWIVDDGLPEPVMHFWVVCDGRRYCIDLAYPPPIKIAIETDGWGPHKGRTPFSGDRAKIRALELAGYLVLPYTSDTPRLTVVREVRQALEQRSGL